MPEPKQLVPVRVGRVLVHEWVSDVQPLDSVRHRRGEWLIAEGTVAGYARIRYFERIVFKEPGAEAWQILDGRSPVARRFRLKRRKRFLTRLAGKSETGG